jgi:hypothetical protein
VALHFPPARAHLFDAQGTAFAPAWVDAGAALTA